MLMYLSRAIKWELFILWNVILYESVHKEKLQEVFLKKYFNLKKRKLGQTFLVSERLQFNPDS
jgi:hypothetical protein